MIKICLWHIPLGSNTLVCIYLSFSSVAIPCSLIVMREKYEMAYTVLSEEFNGQNKAPVAREQLTMHCKPF